MTDDYQEFVDDDKAFRDELQTFRDKKPELEILPDSTVALNETLFKNLTKYCQDYNEGKKKWEKIPVPIKENMIKYRLEGCKGQQMLSAFTKSVQNQANFEKGRCFYLRCGSNESRDIILLANPTKEQPGNGIIITSANVSNTQGNKQPSSYQYILAKGSELRGFWEYFKKFMTKPVSLNGNDIFFELSVLILYEIARRLVPDIEKSPRKKKSLDSIPVLSCIVACLLRVESRNNWEKNALKKMDKTSDESSKNLLMSFMKDLLDHEEEILEELIDVFRGDRREAAAVNMHKRFFKRANNAKKQDLKQNLNDKSKELFIPEIEDLSKSVQGLNLTPSASFSEETPSSSGTTSRNLKKQSAKKKK